MKGPSRRICVEMVWGSGQEGAGGLQTLRSLKCCWQSHAVAVIISCLF
jgi:hypothetical protein